MKILHVAYFGKDKLNGISHVVLALAKEQRAMGHNVKISINTVHSIIDNQEIIYSKKQREFYALVKLFNPDIVVFHTFYDYIHYKFSKTLKQCNIPYAIMFHGGATIDNLGRSFLKKKIANYLLFNSYVEKSNGVIYLNDAESDKSIFKKQQPNATIIPNGINLPDIKFDNISKNKIRFSFLGRLDVWHKGLDLLISALDLIKSSEINNKIEFKFYGPKEDDFYKELNNFGSLVEYCGYVSGDSKCEAFKNTDIFISPSRMEGMPMAILEALSYGIPCIITPQTNVESLIVSNKCGWVTSLNSNDIYKSIVSAYYDFIKNKEELFYNSRKSVEELTWFNIANRHIAFYQSIIRQ